MQEGSSGVGEGGERESGGDEGGGRDGGRDARGGKRGENTNNESNNFSDTVTAIQMKLIQLLSN